MKKELFLEKIRNSRLGEIFFFVVVAQTETESTIIVLYKSTQRVAVTFNYDESGLIYNFGNAETSFYILKEMVDTLCAILDEGE